MQKSYSFTLKARASKEDMKTKRFIIKRKIVEKIRRGLGKSVGDLNDQGGSFEYLVGRNDDMSPVQSAAAISKWHVSFDDETTQALKQADAADVSLSGTITLLLEEENKHNDALISQLIVMSAKLNDIELSPLGVQTTDVNYEITDHSHTYEIECFLRPVLSPAPNIENEELRREKTKEILNYRYPLSNDPESKKRLARYCGESVKRHIIETAKHHKLNVDALINTIFMVKAYWIAMPVKGSKLTTSRGEACTVIFQTPIELQGTWTAGSYRHKGMGLIKKAEPGVAEKFKVGEFIL